MTHVLIAADVIQTLSILALVAVVIVLLVTAASWNQVRLRRYRRNHEGDFWHTEESPDLLASDLQEIAQQTFSHNEPDLSIYKSHDNSNHATSAGSSGSILGLDGGIATGGLDDSSGVGALGDAVADYFEPDNSGGGYIDVSDSSSSSSSNDN